MNFDNDSGWAFAPTDNMKHRTLEEIRSRDARIVWGTIVTIVVVAAVAGVLVAVFV